MAAVVPFIPYIISAIGVGVSYEGQRKAGSQAEDARRMQAEALGEQASQIERQGEREEDIARGRLRQLLAKQRTAYAKAGVDLSTGSPLTILAATAAEGEKELGLIRQETKETAAATRKGAQLQTLYGRSERAAGRTGATGTLLAGLGSVGSGAYKTYKSK